MENFVQIAVNDTSPTIFYSPFGDTNSSFPDLSAGWNPYYNLYGFATSLGEIGNGTSSHITSHDGAYLTLQWHGTGIQLIGNATLASYTIQVDGNPITISDPPTNNTLVTITGLDDAQHNITLTAHTHQVANPNSSMIVFECAIITSAQTPISSNSSLQPQTINDNDIAFLGRWSFETNHSGSSFHTSQTTGDRAQVSFNGTTFILEGVTSPISGNYTVTIDNVTSTLTGLSSFTQYESLLFFATDLDPEKVHFVEVENIGEGELSLLVGGFKTFVPVNSPVQPTTTAAPVLETVSMTFPEGTIAALILAGILAFFLITGGLFYCLFYRPRIRKRKALLARGRIRQSPKQQEIGVIDITSDEEFTKHQNLEPYLEMEDQRLSGFSHWRRAAVHGSLGEMGLPLRFSHTDSPDEKSSIINNNSHRSRSEVSDPPSTDSSTRRKRTKAKGKARQITGASWSPSFTVGLPVHTSSSARVVSMDRVSSFIAAEPPSPIRIRNPDPPSYAASVSYHGSVKRSNTGPSFNASVAPRNSPQSPAIHSHPLILRESSRGFLLHGSEPNSDQDSPPDPLLLPASDVISLRPLTRHDSVNLDKPGPSASRQSHHRREANVDNNNSDSASDSPPSRRLLAQEDIGERQLADIPKPLPLAPANENDMEEGDLIVDDNVFLDVRDLSPFRVDFDSISLLPVTNSETAASDDPGSSRPLPEFVQRMPKPPFRLTPMTFPLPNEPQANSSSGSDRVTSFLDLTSSREGSMISHSIRSRRSRTGNGSDNERPHTSFDEFRLSVPIREPRSRWSDTTVPSISTTYPPAPANDSSGESHREAAPSEARSSNPFPIPVCVNIPPSPHHIMDPTRPSASAVQTVDPLLENLESSPTDSVPLSVVSDIRFRHSDTEEHLNSRRMTEGSLAFQTGHPPLPGSQTTIIDVPRPRPFDPSILVSRVLGMPSPSSSSTVRPAHSRSESIPPTPGHSIGQRSTSRLGSISSNDRLNAFDKPGPSSFT